MIEITPTEIKYKYCDNITGPTYVTYRYDVSYIKYANGKLDYFKNEFAPRTQNWQQGGYESDDERALKNMSTTGLVFGIVSVIPFFGFFTSIIAIILGATCLNKIRKDLSLLPYKRRSIAALVLGIIGFLFLPTLLILALAGVI